MPIPAAPTVPQTVRERIIDRLQAKLASIQTEEGSPIWHHVYIGDIDEIPNVQLPAVAIEEGLETVSERMGGCTVYDLSVFFRFRWEPEDGVANLSIYKYYLGRLQKAMLPDHNLAESPSDIYGLAIDIIEESNSPAIVGADDEHPGGDLTVVIRYRTATHDPYKKPGEP